MPRNPTPEPAAFATRWMPGLSPAAPVAVAFGYNPTLVFCQSEGIMEETGCRIEGANMAEPFQRMLSGYRAYRTRAATLDYIARLEDEIEKRVRTFRAIKAKRRPTPEEWRAFLLIDGLSDFAARARADLRELPD